MIMNQLNASDKSACVGHVEDIKDSPSSFPACVISKGNREENSVPHVLGKLGISVSGAYICF
jgi:hypothetical protein